MRLTSVAMGPVRLDQLEFRMRFQANVAPVRRYVFGQLISGRIRYDSDGEEREYLAGDVYLAAQPDHSFTATVEDSMIALATIDPTVIDHVAQTGPGRPESVRFTGYGAISPRTAQAWKSIYAHLHEDVLTNPEMMAHPLVAGNAARLLVATALATFPNTALTDPTIEDRHDAHPQTLRRAIAFIEAHADRDISATDIARAASVTVRTVQLAFRRHLGTTPMAHLRRVRLDCARAELRAAALGQDTVTQIAARWGYGRPSVFAAHYRATYSETPSQTLRNRWPA
ncbi:MAG: helix-turn-helix domain-containing protein [Pseudonocardia sp.]|nr:helix-turn-helix domain-containing protein [Pseudonocardia sp.]